MQRHPVHSSVLQSVGYDPGTKILELEFKEGGTYNYFNLSPQVYKDLSVPNHLDISSLKE